MSEQGFAKRGSKSGASNNLRLAREVVADGLREEILSGVLGGGQPLRQVDIASRFEVSAIPVREALRQLGGEGLVTFYPRRGAVVASLSRNEVREICEMREALETLALRKALPNMTADDLSHAQKVLDDADEESDEQLLLRWGEMNLEFHETLYLPAGRPKLLSTIKNLHTNFDRYLRVHFSAMHYREKGQQEHRAILRHCQQGNEENAVEALHLHISTVNEMLMEYLDGEETDGTAR